MPLLPHLNRPRLPRLPVVLALFLTFLGLAAHSSTHPSQVVARAVRFFDTDPRFGMDGILPDKYTHVPGISPTFAWATTAAKDGAKINRFSFDWQQVEPRSGVFDWRMPEAFVRS